MKHILPTFFLLIFLTDCSQRLEHENIEPLPTAVTSHADVEINASKNAYFGDTHIHTSWSFDAFINNVRTSPDDAYRFGKGEVIDHVSGTIQANRPLDFMAVSDHAEYMGAMIQMLDKNTPIAQTSLAEKFQSTDKEVFKKAVRKIRMSVAMNWPYQELIEREVLQSTWEKIVAAADRHYEPGKFTTFPAYEWTSSLGVYSSLLSSAPYAQNMHRNVIFKGGKVTGVPFSSFDSQNPEDLWKWMALQREKGIDLFAIPHNGNISDGRMYAMSTFDGDPIDLAYTKTRMRNEPVNEVAQNKGQSMAHPVLSPNDEFADFEVYPYALGTGDPRKEGQIDGSYVRQALKNGLAIDQQVGGNPFQFGIIGSSDTHNSASQVEEDNSFGKSGLMDPTPEARLAKNSNGERNRKSAVQGLAGVWATQNTREAIFEAFERKEVFATSGPRMKVRFFASWDFDTLNFSQTDWPLAAYKLGVAMGSEIKNLGENKAPQFLIHAIKDNEGANLDRIQVVKGWVDNDGVTHEKIFDVAWSGERKRNKNGKVPSVGSTVDLKTATYSNDIGAVALQTAWSDPEFDASFSTFYYLRVLEIPTPRWTTYEAVKIGVPNSNEVAPTVQERAWSSPIWYRP